MANFKTHLFVASGLSGMAAIACMKAGVVVAAETPLLLGLGAFGGLLPDIDSDHSVPIKISFNVLAVILAFMVLFAFVGHYTVLELALLWLGVFLGVRYGILSLFIRCTTHRGTFHSLLAAVFFGLGTVSLAHHLFSKAYPIAWAYGTFVVFGFVVHLLLDELFSVDLLNHRVKRSFGSALKIVSLKYWQATLLLLCATVGVYSTVAYPPGFFPTAWKQLETHYSRRGPWLIPAKGQWFRDFQGIIMHSFCRGQAPGTRPVSTQASTATLQPMRTKP